MIMLRRKLARPRDARPGATMFSRLKRELLAAFAAAAGVTLFVNLGLLFVPTYDMILYDRVLQSKNMDTIAILTIGCAVGMGIFGILEYCRSIIFVAAADRLARRLNLPAFEATLARSLAGDAAAAGQAMRDLNELRLFASSPAAAIPFDLLWTPALLLVLWLLHPDYGLYGLACAAILFVLSLATDLATREDLTSANAATAACLNELSSALHNVELLDGMGMLPAVARRWRRRHGAALDMLSRAGRRAKAFAAAARTTRLAMQAGVILIGVVLVMGYQASPGSMMGANLIVAKLLLPFDLLVSGWRQWTSAAAAWGRIRALLDRSGATDVATASPATAPIPALAPGEDGDPVVIVDNAAFTPPGALSPALQCVSFTANAGEAVALVGPSGSGKSSLARLLVGVFAPQSGRVLVYGRAPRDWDRAEFGRRVGYLPQSVSFLDETVLANISRLQEEDPAAAVEAARAAAVHDLIGRLPDGYATWVGGQGRALSGGQRQRVALARALYGAPRLLVLDEPNANLDHEGELALIQAVRDAKASGACVVLITHRPAALAACDRVLVMEAGRIVRTMEAREWSAAQTAEVPPARARLAPA